MTWKPRTSNGWPAFSDRFREVESQVLADYLEQLVEDSTADFLSVVGQLTYECESPIEALFLVAFVPYMLRDPGYHIEPQAPIGKYRADFLVTFSPRPDASRSLVVECDGHDYHERTKEQAERDKRRDRAISAEGLPVFRFTGRELHRDAQACVEEVIDFTQGPLIDEMNDEARRGR